MAIHPQLASVYNNEPLASKRRLLVQDDLGEFPDAHEDLIEHCLLLQAEYQRRAVALASASHELRTPITILGGYADLLLSENPGPLSDDQRKIVLEMQSNRSRLQSVIDDFLNYAAFATGHLQMQVVQNDLNRCLEETSEI